MQLKLITIIMFAVAILTILSGISTFFGSKKQNKMSAIWMLVVTFGLAVWSSSIAVFLSLGSGGYETAKGLIVGIIFGITVADIGLIGYSGWNYLAGKIALVVLAMVGAFAVGTLALHPEVFYSNIELFDPSLNLCNKMEVVKNGWYYYFLMGFYGVNTFTFLGFLLYTIRKTTNRKAKIGLIIFYVGLAISGVFDLIFDLILLSSTPDFIWVGPVSTSIIIITYYYSVVRYRLLALTSGWMKVFSFLILIIAVGIVYVLTFYLVFMILFRQPNPSMPVLLLNFVMAGIVLCLVPAISEIFNFMSSLTSSRENNIGYIVKKLNHVTKKTANLKEIAGFLADHLHFEYVGFLVNGRLYGSGVLDISSNELVEISKLKTPSRGIWQEANAAVNKTFIDADIRYVAELYNNKGYVFGQILIGRPLNKKTLDRKDLIETEMVINLVASIVDGVKR